MSRRQPEWPFETRLILWLYAAAKFEGGPRVQKNNLASWMRHDAACAGQSGDGAETFTGSATGYTDVPAT